MARLDTNEITFDSEDVVDCGTEKRKRGGQKKTHDEFVNKVLGINSSVKVIGQYIDSKTKIKIKCDVCNYEWEIRPSEAHRVKCAKCAGCAKLTHEEFMQRVRMNQNNDSLTVVGKYVDRHTKVLCKCETCGALLNMEPRTLYSGEGCVQCSGNHKKTHDEFVEQLKNVNKDVEVIGRYVNANTHVDCKCLLCGTVWKSTPQHLFRLQGCPECGKKKNADARRKPHDVFIKELAKINPNITVLGEYQGNSIGVECKCNICGNVWNGIPSNLLQSLGCRICGIQRRADAQRKSHEEFVSEVKKINPYVQVVGTYINSDSKIECKCLRCEKTLFYRPTELMRGYGCTWCSRSQTSCMERSILFFLQEKLGKENVLWRDRSIGRELDIYSPGLRFAIEPGSWAWHSKLITKDKAKRELCAKHGIRIITLYDSFNGDRKDLGFDEDVITCSCNLGELKNRDQLKEQIKNIFKILGLTYDFTDDQERELLIKAKIMTTRKTKTDVVEELSVVHPNIRLIGDYEGSTAKSLYRCDVCGHEWEQYAYRLITLGSGCPVCTGIQKPVVNLDTGETFERIIDAAAYVGCKAGSISRVCNGKQKSYGGQHFAFIKDLTTEQLTDLRAKFPDTFKY